MTRSIVLSGFMGTGKSTVGPLVAERLGLPFVDVDREIERASSRTVREIWDREGEAPFRAREAALVLALLVQDTPKVIALGGGAVANPKTRRLAIDRAIVVTLTATPETILERIGDASSRPNLAVGGDAAVRTRQLLAERANAYAECHASIATDATPPEAIADAIGTVARRDPLLVPLGTRSYPIDVCIDEPARLAEALARSEPSSLVLVTDSNVSTARGEAIASALAPFETRVTRVVLAPGEENKTLASVAAIWDAALTTGVDRDAVVVAAGGGVIGDLAGFAAASLLRGVRFVQVPTTLLSMVDSSVGGKTGFDHASGKNLIGAFHQPSAVVADLAHLDTLEARQRAAGLAEAVKIALATDEKLLARIEQSAPALAAGDRAALLPVVRDAIQAKIRVVRDDERESGPRALLNVGHTVGHALEAHGSFARWLHGEAVALGTVAELGASTALGWTEPDLVERSTRLFAALGLPTRVDPDELAGAWPFVVRDKKRAGEMLKWPIVTKAGTSHVERVKLGDLRRALLQA